MAEQDNDDRLELRVEQFAKALAALKLALAQPEDEFVRDSIIKRFELSFETARKAMRQWLVEQQEIKSSATKKEVLEAAFRTGLVGDPDVWNELAAKRNDTSHEYDANEALAIVAFVRQKSEQPFETLLAELKNRS